MEEAVIPGDSETVTVRFMQRMSSEAQEKHNRKERKKIINNRKTTQPDKRTHPGNVRNSAQNYHERKLHSTENYTEKRRRSLGAAREA